jgi:hypothetical protein
MLLRNQACNSMQLRDISNQICLQEVGKVPSCRKLNAFYLYPVPTFSPHNQACQQAGWLVEGLGA